MPAVFNEIRIEILIADSINTSCVALYTKFSLSFLSKKNTEKYFLTNTFEDFLVKIKMKIFSMRMKMIRQK